MGTGGLAKFFVKSSNSFDLFIVLLTSAAQLAQVRTILLVASAIGSSMRGAPICDGDWAHDVRRDVALRSVGD
eukprot:3935711-Rhodomonas_salina.2